MTTTVGATFTTTVRVIHRVHGDTAHRRPTTAPARGTGLAERNQGVLMIADIANRGPAMHMHPANLARPQTYGDVITAARGNLGAGAGTARQLTTLARTHFNAMYRRAHRNGGQRQGVATSNRCLGAGNHAVADLQAPRRNDVSPFAVRVQQQRQVG